MLDTHRCPKIVKRSNPMRCPTSSDVSLPLHALRRTRGVRDGTIGPRPRNGDVESDECGKTVNPRTRRSHRHGDAAPRGAPCSFGQRPQSSGVDVRDEAEVPRELPVLRCAREKIRQFRVPKGERPACLQQRSVGRNAFAGTQLEWRFHEQHRDRARVGAVGACGAALQPQPPPPEAFTAASCAQQPSRPSGAGPPQQALAAPRAAARRPASVVIVESVFSIAAS